MGYQHLDDTLKAVAITAPAARAFELAFGEGKDTATVGRLEDDFRDRPAMKACVERMKAGYTYARVMKHLGDTAHFYGDRPSLVEDIDYATIPPHRDRVLHDRSERARGDRDSVAIRPS